MPLPRTPVPKDQPPKSSRKTSTLGGSTSKPGVTRPPTPASVVEFSDDETFEHSSVMTETPKGSDSAARLVMSASTLPPASAVDAGDVGGGGGDETQPGTFQPGNDEQSGSGLSREKEYCYGN
jgi:hypothetical protein